MTDIKSVLVTGGTGNIGGAIVQELIKHHYSVTVLCRSEQSAEKAQSYGAAVLHGDIGDPSGWSDGLGDFDALIHTACSFEEDMGDIDRLFIRTIAQEAEKRRDDLIVLYTTGCWNFGSHADKVHESTEKVPMADFKWMLENGDYLLQQRGVDVRFVSPVNVVDVEVGSVPPILHWELERHGQPCVPETKDLTWSLIDRRNLAELYRLVLENGQSGEEYIGSGSDHSVQELAQSLSDEPLKYVPLSDWSVTYGSWSEGYGLKQLFSSQKAMQTLGWVPKPINITGL